jgi:hypothetical protein
MVAAIIVEDGDWDGGHLELASDPLRETEFRFIADLAVIEELKISPRGSEGLET